MTTNLSKRDAFANVLEALRDMHAHICCTECMAIEDLYTHCDACERGHKAIEEAKRIMRDWKGE
jgi:hypothetical protein